MQKPFESLTSAAITSWFSQSLVNLLLLDSPDPFAPYSRFSNSFDPVGKIISFANDSNSLTLLRGLSAGLSRFGRFMTSKNDFALQSYTTPLTQFHRLTRSLMAVECIDSLSLILKRTALHHDNSFYLDCVQTASILGSQFTTCFRASSRHRKMLEITLIECALHRFFTPSYSPIILHSLIQTEPLNFWRHLELLSHHVNTLGKQDEDQQKLAHLTAEKILKQTAQFVAYSDRFQFENADSPHFWLFEALFSAAGPLQLMFDNENIWLPTVVRKSNPSMSIPIKENSDWASSPICATPRQYPVAAAAQAASLCSKLMLGREHKKEAHHE
jgi:hypothetical protein